MNFTSTAVVSTASPAKSRVLLNGMTSRELSDTARAKLRLALAVLLVMPLAEPVAAVEARLDHALDAGRGGRAGVVEDQVVVRQVELAARRRC